MQSPHIASTYMKRLLLSRPYNVVWDVLVRAIYTLLQSQKAVYAYL